jgi:hypothetical protein
MKDVTEGIAASGRMVDSESRTLVLLYDIVSLEFDAASKVIYRVEVFFEKETEMILIILWCEFLRNRSFHRNMVARRCGGAGRLSCMKWDRNCGTQCNQPLWRSIYSYLKQRV